MNNPLETIYEEIACTHTECDAQYEDEAQAWEHAEKFRGHRLLGTKLAITESESEYEITFWIPPFEGYFPREKYE